MAYRSLEKRAREERARLFLPLVVVVPLFAAVAVLSCARQASAPRSAARAARPTTTPPTAPPPLSLVPADVARAGLIGTFVIPSLERSLASGVSLVKQAAPLPLDAAGVRDMLLAQAGLPPDIAKHLDISAPIAGAAVVSGRTAAPLSAFSFAARSPADVAALLTALGRTISRRGNAVQIENAAGDRGWFLSMANLVVFADTDEALVRAGSLAVEARRQAKDDVAVLLYPEMAARAAGIALDAALEQVRQAVEERMAAGGGKMGPEGARQMRLLIDYVGDIATAELALQLDDVRGASVLARLNPKPGSKLETLARDTETNPVDPALARGVARNDDAAIVLSSAYGGPTLQQLSRVRGKLPASGGRSVLATAHLFDELVAGLSGRFSLLGRVQPALSSEIVLPLRAAAGAGRLETALLATDKDGLTALLRAATEGEGLDLKGVKVLTVKRENLGREGPGREAAKKVRAIHATVGFRLPAKVDPAVAKLLGPRVMDLYAAIVGRDRLALTIGQGAKTRLANIIGDKAPTPTAKVTSTSSAKDTVVAASSSGAVSAMTDALGHAGPRSFFYLLDLRQAVFLLAATGADARSRMISSAVRAPMPILGGATGDGQGRSLTLDLTIPPSCFSGIGAVVQAAMLTRN